MKKIILLLVIGSVLVSCRRKDKNLVSFVSPEAGTVVPSGKNILLKTDAESGTFDSITYYIDTAFAGSRKDTTSISVSTNGLTLGARLLTAKVYKGGVPTEVTSNIQLLPANAPKRYSYKVINTFPHDTSSYTEGLEFHDGYLYESDGGYEDSSTGASSLRKVDLKTGKVLKQIDIKGHIFAEGLTIIGDKIIQITYQEGVGFEYDKNTFKKLRDFPYTAGREGWGLCFDGDRILNSDGTNTIYFLNKETYQKQGSFDVFDNKGPVQQLNELEYIDGKIFSNIYLENRIVIIDPKTGAVEADINLEELDPYRGQNRDLVLNGIAWDARGRRLFVTGKKWDKLFEIKIM
jgi:glutamine cyclotransferase